MFLGKEVDSKTCCNEDNIAGVIQDRQSQGYSLRRGLRTVTNGCYNTTLKKLSILAFIIIKKAF
jgi:hypothetical protein